MVVPDKTIFIQAANFLFMVWALNKMLIGPIRKIIKKRNDLMADQLEKIEGFTGSAEEKIAGYESQLSGARKEAGEIRTAIKGEGSAEEQTLLASAGTEASSTIQAARAEIKSQVKDVMGQLTKDVDKYAEQATGRILGQA